MPTEITIGQKAKARIDVLKTRISDILGLQEALDGKAAVTHNHTNDSWLTTLLNGKADKIEFTAKEGRTGGISGLDNIVTPDFYCGVYKGERLGEKYAATLSVTLSRDVTTQEIEYNAPNGKKRYKRTKPHGVWSEWELVPNTIAIADVDGLQTALEYKMDATPHLADSGERENIDALYASHKGAAIVIDNFAGKSLSEYLYSASGKPIYLSNDLQQGALYLIRIQYIDYAYLVEAIAFNEPMSNQ